MTTTIYRLDVNAKTITQISRKSMAQLSLSEPYDLEAWLASASAGIFDRDILWIARQDRPVDEQRSDLIGVDKAGNLLITELKRGELNEYAITQALAYAAEYSRKTADELATMFADQSSRETATGLVTKATSADDARLQLSNHVGPETELNDAQILMLVGEEFTPGALAICDYLNESSGEGTFSFECWKFTVFQEVSEHIFALEQILPPPSVRRAIDERREAARAKRYARDPVRKDFMYAVMSFLGVKAPGLATRSRGASYDCWLKKDEWKATGDVNFSVHEDCPRLILPDGLVFAATDGGPNVTVEQVDGGEQSLRFNGIQCATAKFDESFGDQLLKVVEQIKPKPDGGLQASAPAGIGNATSPEVDRV